MAHESLIAALACPTCKRPYPRVPVQDYPRPTEEELLALAPAGSRWACQFNPEEIADSLGIDPDWRNPLLWHEEYVPEPQLRFRVVKASGYVDVFSVPCTQVRDGGIYTRLPDAA